MVTIAILFSLSLFSPQFLNYSLLFSLNSISSLRSFSLHSLVLPHDLLLVPLQYLIFLHDLISVFYVRIFSFSIHYFLSFAFILLLFSQFPLIITHSLRVVP